MIRNPRTKRDDIADKVEITAADYTGFCDKNGKTGDAAEGEVVGEFEEINTACHDGGSSSHHGKFLNLRLLLDVGLRFWDRILSYPRDVVQSFLLPRFLSFF